MLAYKDEYEVARLHSDPVFIESLRKQFDGEMRIEFNLAPPLLSRRDPVTGLTKKRAFGAWILPVFRLLALGKRLRGSKFDVFGYTSERRMERELIAEFENLVDDILDHLSVDNFATAVQLAELPETIRGFGHVKLQHVERTRQRWAELRKTFDGINRGDTRDIQRTA